ncbi:MAG: hypothetical protein GY943_03190 [Chloroflexi bacterium]|nr:hypothetical protein [Chloroflexota bacterium]
MDMSLRYSPNGIYAINPKWQLRGDINKLLLHKISLDEIKFLALLFFIEKYQPTIAFWLPPVMFIIGIVMFVLAAISYGKYRNIFDYEPTTILGRPANGNGHEACTKTPLYLGDGWD